MVMAHDVRDGAQTRSALRVLAEALGDGVVATEERVCASPHAHSPEEGLALLSAYVGIAPVALRQAILDVVLTLSHRSTPPGRR